MSHVLVTGCSSGFGLETAVELAQRDWHLFATMRNLDKRGRLDSFLTRSDKVDVLQLDVTDAASIEHAVKELLAFTGGRLEAVVHNAGVSHGAAFEDVPDDEARRVFETNFFGVLALTRAVLPVMREQRSGRIVLISSDSAFYGAPGLSIYTASKWALEGWAESIAYEVEPFGIQVVCVEPGSYRTEIWDSSPRIIPPDSAYRELAEIEEKAVQEQLVARARDPKEVAKVVARALEARQPRFRYPVGPDAKAMATARGIVPRRAQAALVKRILGIHRWKP